MEKYLLDAINAIQGSHHEGAGTMGNGIVQASTQAGLDVIMMDLSSDVAPKGMIAIDKSLQRMVEKGR